MSYHDEMDRLRQANPVTIEPGPHSKARRTFRRAGQTLFALIGVLVVGVGAAWATTGTNPVTSIFKKDLKVVESDYGLDSFSILEPMTQEKFDALPRRVAMLTSMMASMHRLSSSLEKGKRIDNERQRRYPVGISAIGQGTSSTGTDVTMLVMAEKICTIWEAGVSNCAPIEGINESLAIGGAPEPSRRNLWRLNGMATDEVVSIKIDGSDDPPVPVQDNVFELRNMAPKNVRLIGLDEDGEEVVVTGAPIAGWVSLGE